MKLNMCCYINFFLYICRKLGYEFLVVSYVFSFIDYLFSLLIVYSVTLEIQIHF